MKVYKAPDYYNPWEPGLKIFLAGSIDMGQAVDWQTQTIELLEKNKHRFDANLIVLNPRRDDWDSSWEQKIDNPQFNEQVSWELDALESSHYILMYFAPETKAPVTMLEFGLYAESGKLIVCCPEGFWRKGNVDIVCDRYNIKQVESIEEFIEELPRKKNES